MSGRGKTVGIAVSVLVGVIFIAGSAYASSTMNPTTSYQGLLSLIKSGADSWNSTLLTYAKSLFWSLAAIQLVWTFFPLVMKQSDFGEIIGELVRYIMVIGFFYAMLANSVTWATDIVNSFREAGAAAAGVSSKALQPGDMFGFAIEMGTTINSVQTMNPLVAFSVTISAGIVILCFAFIAAFMGLCLVESYVVINASVLFLGFGGSQWTREYALAMVKYAISVGAKLFILTLIVGLIVTSANKWQTAYNNDQASMWTMVGLSLVCAYLAKSIPELVQGLITGTSFGGGAAIGGMAAAAFIGASAGVAAVSGGIAEAAAKSAGNELGGGGMLGGMGGGGGGGFSGGGGGMGGASSGASSAMNAASNSISPRTGGSGSLSTKAGSVTGAGSSSSSPAMKRAKIAGGVHTALSGLTRGAGVMAAISVPGMESASYASLGPAPNISGMNNLGAGGGENSFSSGEGNTISPASSTTDKTSNQSPDGERGV